MAEEAGAVRAPSHVNSIAGVWLDEAGFVHTAYGTYHPVTGEGLPINAPPELMREILLALLRDGEESGPATEFDWDLLLREPSGDF